MPEESSAVWRSLQSNELDRYYVSRSGAAGDRSIASATQAGPCFAIDEAHCVSKGPRLRPELPAAQSELAAAPPPSSPAQLTATADSPQLRAEIRDAAGPWSGTGVHRQFRSAQHPLPAAQQTTQSPACLAFLGDYRGEAGIVYPPARAAGGRSASRAAGGRHDRCAYHTRAGGGATRRGASIAPA